MSGTLTQGCVHISPLLSQNSVIAAECREIPALSAGMTDSSAGMTDNLSGWLGLWLVARVC